MSLEFLFFFFNDTATTEIYTLSLHDALPIYLRRQRESHAEIDGAKRLNLLRRAGLLRAELIAGKTDHGEILIFERSEEHTSELSHANISYAVFCLKKKNEQD